MEKTVEIPSTEKVAPIKANVIRAVFAAIRNNQGSVNGDIRKHTPIIAHLSSIREELNAEFKIKIPDTGAQMPTVGDLVDEVINNLPEIKKAVTELWPKLAEVPNTKEDD